MVDTFRPLLLADGARACEDPDYPWSWSRPRPGSAGDPES
jgi:homogentisate 1,2-dioxygenase